MSPRLPQWLTIREAAAWVGFRTGEAVEKSKSQEGFAALRFFGWQLVVAKPTGASPAEHEKLAEKELTRRALALRSFLLSGSIRARGKIAGQQTIEIPAADWVHLPFGTRISERQAPYQEILIHRRELLRHFPAAPRQSRSPYNIERAAELYRELPEGLSQGEAARELRFRYEQEVDKVCVPAEQTVEGWVRAWRKGSADF